MKTEKTQAQKEAIKYLKSVVKKDSELLVNIHSVSASGMSRKMSIYVIAGVTFWKTKEGKDYKATQKDLVKLNWHLKKADFASLDKNGQIKVSGCGMDMAFSVTYNLKCALYGHKEGIKNQQYRLI